jgi:RecB family exonuclease
MAVTLSHSSISTYRDCPQKWKLKYVDKLPEKPRHFFSFGKSVHDALEYFYAVQALPPKPLEDVLRHYRENWISEGYANAAQEEEYKAEGERILGDYHRKHYDTFRIPYFTEYAFTFDVDGVPVRGFVDRVDKVGEDRIAILDYKTGKAIPASRAEQDQQLTMYQMACEELLGKTVETLTLYHLPSQKALTVPRHGKELVQGLRAQVVEVAGAIGREVFDPKPEERKCSWCDFKPHCPVFKHLYPGAPVSPAAAAAEAAPKPGTDKALAKLVDKVGKAAEDLEKRRQALEELKAELAQALKEKGFVKAFGSAFEAARQSSERWEFSDRKKVLDEIQRAGFWDKIMAPSAPLVQKLMTDPAVPLHLREKLARLATRSEKDELSIKRVADEGAG